MAKIAVVEDNDAMRGELCGFIAQYAQESGCQLDVTPFADGSQLVEPYRPGFDIIFLDIEMPTLGGMPTAERIRMLDPDVILIFVTNMAQYAIHGYSVGALDFVMKPISYYPFSMKIKRALKRVQKKEIPTILLTTSDGVKRLKVSQIYYVEIQGHMLHYYTEEGEFVMRGTLSSVEKMLPSSLFVKCNHWYLVNLMHVTEVRKNTTVVGNFELEVSRRNRAGFLKALAEHMGGNA